MREIRLFNKLAKLVLLFTYLVVLAGGFVRMTGSGMGCPDWPKCFGFWVPPTSEHQLPDNYIERYQISPNHNAEFNVNKTWTEYINRCIGAFTGLLVVGLCVLSVIIYKKSSIQNYFFGRKIFTYSFLLVLLFGLQAWIGGEVVYSVLNPFKVSIHMFVALIIICFIILLIHITNKKTFFPINITRPIKFLFFCVIGLSLAQIFLGSQVREFLDSLGLDKTSWSDMIQESYISIHKFVGGLVFLFNIILVILLNNNIISLKVFPKEIFGIILVLVFSVLSGGTMITFNFPGLAQLIHLISAFTLFGCQISLFLKFNRATSIQ